jgi:hypothetical protein
VNVTAPPRARRVEPLDYATETDRQASNGRVQRQSNSRTHANAAASSPGQRAVARHVRALTFDAAIASGDAFEIDGRRIPIIGLEALLRNKRAAGREQDLADVAALQAVAPKSSRQG